MGTLAIALVLSAAVAPPSLDALAAHVRSAPAWQASFTQSYVPAGLDEGTTDQGAVVVSPPDLLRFDYTGDTPRTFAFDGRVARSVDPAAATCDAIAIDPGRLDRLPLSVLLDPTASAGRLTVKVDGDELVLTPVHPDPDVAEIRIEPGSDGMPTRFVVTDAEGNVNRFTFSSWTPRPAPAPSLFRPALPGAAPCQPRDR